VDKWLERNLTLKVLSLLLAVILWFRVISDLNPIVNEAVSDVAVNYMAPSGGFVLIANSPESASIVIQGRERLLAQIDRGEILLKADTSALGSGSHEVDLEVTLPPGLELISIEPAMALVQIDAVVSATFPVQVTLQGKMEPNFSTLTPSVTPDEVVITGPESQVNRVARVVAQVDVSGVTEPISLTMLARPVDREGSPLVGLEADPAEVSVEVPVVALPPQKSVPVLARITGVPAEGWEVKRITVSPAEVSIRAPARVLENVSTVQTALVDVGGMSGTYALAVPVDVPLGVQISEPALVSITVVLEEEITERAFDPVQVSVVNTVEGQTVTLTPESISVVVTGPILNLSGFSLESIEATIDASELGPGEYHLRPTIMLPPGFEVVSHAPEMITVTIEETQ